MLSKPPPKPSDPLDLEFPDGRREALAYVGPSMQGWIFRSRREDACYRLLPIRDGGPPCLDDAPIERRHDIRAWTGRPRVPGLAPIVAADTCTIGGGNYFFVRYEIDPKQSLSDALQDSDRGARLGFALRALKALPAWWERLHAGLLPMPADIFFVGRDPWLLALPFRPSPHLPDCQVVLTEPTRAWYLAPELVGGRLNAVQGDNLDRYALGVALWQCFYKLPAAPRRPAGRTPLNVLGQVITGAIATPRRQESDMPYWLERVEDAKQAIAAVGRLLAPDPKARASLSPHALADYLDNCRKKMEPAEAVNWLLANKRVHEAYDLLQDILLERDSYDLLVLAGEIAGQFLHRHLEAGELYEKAIERAPAQSKAYDNQFVALLQGQNDLSAALARAAPESRRDLAHAQDQLDARVKRDFDRMSPLRQEQRAAALARHLIKRGKLSDACRWIYPRLEDVQRVWRKFDLALAYVEAYKGLAALDRTHLEKAQMQLQFTRNKLREAEQQPGVLKETLEDYGFLLDKIEQELFLLASTSAGPAQRLEGA